MEEQWQLTDIKRRWIPQWLFTLCKNLCRLIGSDLSEYPRLVFLLTTKSFHYHDIGGPIYSKPQNCKYCRQINGEE